MRVQHICDVVVGAMVQLLHCRFFTVLCCEVLSVFIVASREHFIFDRLDANQSWMPGVKWGRCHEFLFDLCCLGTINVEGCQCVAGICCHPRWVAAEARVRVPKIGPSAIPSNEARALGTR